MEGLTSYYQRASSGGSTLYFAMDDDDKKNKNHQVKSRVCWGISPIGCLLGQTLWDQKHYTTSTVSLFNYFCGKRATGTKETALGRNFLVLIVGDFISLDLHKRGSFP